MKNKSDTPEGSPGKRHTNSVTNAEIVKYLVGKEAKFSEEIAKIHTKLSAGERKTGVTASVLDESKTATGTIRQFRGIMIAPGAVVQIISGRTGKPVTIKLRQLSRQQKEILSEVFDFIEEKLIGTKYEKAITVLMNITGFLVTDSKHVGAYSAQIKDDHMVILNANVITWTRDELAVTILHELLHAVFVSDDRDPASEEEARHDLACYGLLGFSVSTDHWAFIKFPHLMDELVSGGSVVADEPDKD